MSHAWVDDKNLMYVMMPINGGEWPIPIPKDANLDLICIEMLNAMSKWNQTIGLEAEYVCLDVLCLCQEGRKGEHLHLEEWKLDMPTIRAVYQERLYVEMTTNPIFRGETGKYAMDKQVQRMFQEQLESLQCMHIRNPSILGFLTEMRNWVSTKLLDKVVEVVYLLRPNVIPLYNAKQSAADAWEVLVDVIRPRFRVQPLFLMKDTHIDYRMGDFFQSRNVGGLGEVPNKPTPLHGEVDINDA
ncbi:hypothetical protein EDD18DRAFT_1102668 [Armillaria luteobubalina]|uniref:Uncharacterized protein n=1 Tax=Armillaria luteobubalina TaxID=153913 RepID=A0AA39QBZ1_9AGAR|nr:hypothetical protein EDD18DRAFT_1102668 [Armillaria luteobubalina]